MSRRGERRRQIGNTTGSIISTGKNSTSIVCATDDNIALITGWLIRVLGGTTCRGHLSQIYDCQVEMGMPDQGLSARIYEPSLPLSVTRLREVGTSRSSACSRYVLHEYLRLTATWRCIVKLVMTEKRVAQVQLWLRIPIRGGGFWGPRLTMVDNSEARTSDL